MQHFKIENDEIQIHFDGIPSLDIRSELKAEPYRFRWNREQKVWHAPYSEEREDLARKLVNPTEPEDLPEFLPEPKTLDEKLSRIVSTKDKNERARLTDSLTEELTYNIDNYVQALRDYKREETEATEEKKQREASLKDGLDEIIARKKMAEQKRRCLEHILTNYLTSTGEVSLQGSQYNVSFKETNPTYSLSPELEEEIRRRAAVPDWITLELKVDQNAVRELNSLPEGLRETPHFKLQTWTEEEGDPNLPSKDISLNLFKEGMSIRDIAKERGLRWRTIYKHLLDSLNNGQLEITDYLDNDDLNKLVELSGSNDSWRIADFQNALGIETYDYVALALGYLKVGSLD